MEHKAYKVVYIKEILLNYYCNINLKAFQGYILLYMLYAPLNILPFINDWYIKWSKKKYIE